MYTLNFFIRKAENIDPALWITGKYGTEDRHCFLGWLGKREWVDTDEATHVYNLFEKHGLCIVDVNDAPSRKFPQPTPSQRIIAALYWIRGQQAVEQAQEIVNKVGEVV